MVLHANFPDEQGHWFALQTINCRPFFQLKCYWTTQLQGVVANISGQIGPGYCFTVTKLCLTLCIPTDFISGESCPAAPHRHHPPQGSQASEPALVAASGQESTELWAPPFLCPCPALASARMWPGPALHIRAQVPLLQRRGRVSLPGPAAPRT